MLDSDTTTRGEEDLEENDDDDEEEEEEEASALLGKALFMVNDEADGSELALPVERDVGCSSLWGLRSPRS